MIRAPDAVQYAAQRRGAPQIRGPFYDDKIWVSDPRSSARALQRVRDAQRQRYPSPASAANLPGSPSQTMRACSST
ncbi:hypothetical protein BH11PSE4_BH11PSE4_03440 [soil metagenome]